MKKEIIKMIRRGSHKYQPYDVFRDFCEMAAISISNSIDIAQREERETRYMQIVKRYEPETVELFPKMLGCVIMELEAGYSDVLGSVFMEMEFGNTHAGQFFTPYSLCQAMAQLQVDEMTWKLVEKNGFITINEPAVGGGALIIAFAEAMKKAGINYQTKMHIVAQDIDVRSVHMAYIQFALLNIPALVYVGNTLSMEVSSVWRTPAHIFGFWDTKLRQKQSKENDKNEHEPGSPLRRVREDCRESRREGLHAVHDAPERQLSGDQSSGESGTDYSAPCLPGL